MDLELVNNSGMTAALMIINEYIYYAAPHNKVKTSVFAAQIAAEVAKVEAEKPFMQAYKSLMLWKEVRGDEFDIRQLIQAFEENDHGDLARMTRNILDSTCHRVRAGVLG